MNTFFQMKGLPMKQKSTSELLKELNNTNNIENYLKQNNEYMTNTSISDYLYDIFAEKCLIKSRVFKKAEIDEIYGYQIFSGKKNPSRNTLLAICIGAGFSLNEIQASLKVAGFATLYAKSQRDSIIIWGINNNMDVCQINEALFDNNESTLN